MNYQQSQSMAGARGARGRQGVSYLSDPALVAANEQGVLTPPQLFRLATRKHHSTAGCLLLILALMFGSCTGASFFYAAAQSPFNPAWLGALVLPFIAGVVGWILFSAGQAARRRFIDDVANGGYVYPIERTQGEIVWDGSNYVSRTPGGSLGIKGKQLAPGPYVFYYTRDPFLVISVQPIHTHTQMLPLPGTLAATGLPGDEQSRLAIQYALCQALSFTLADLDANRQGFISNEQARRFRRHIPQVVLALTGEISYSSSSSDDSTSYFYNIGGLRFDVSEAATIALVSDIPYCVYYFPRKRRWYSDTLLSVEPLQAPRR